MKHIAIIAAAALAATCALAQDNAGPARSGNRPMPRMHGPMMQQSGMWVTRMLSNKHGLERIGVTDPALRDKIMAAVAPLKEKSEDLEQKIRVLAREQFELMRGLLDDKTREPKPVMEKIGEVARLRAEQGKLSVRAILVLRDNLPPEQLENAKKMIIRNGRERMFSRGPNDGDGNEGMRRGPRGGEGRRPGFFRRRGDGAGDADKNGKGRGKNRAATKDGSKAVE